MPLVGVTLGPEFPGMRQCGASHALRVLTAINMVNFADRYVPAAVKTLFQEELHLTDVQTTFPNTGMIIVYMIFAIFFGTVHDKKLFDRRFLLCGAIIFWSAATALAGLSTNLVQLIALRSLVGVGEAAYGTIAPPMLSDFFQEHERNVVYAVYYLAIPVGAALGYGIGAVLGGAYGWREAFYGVGIPGLVIALSVLSVNDPTYGINDPKLALVAGERGARKRSWEEWLAEAKVELSLWLSDCQEVMTNKPFLVALAGQVANNFGLGGLADWVSAFLIRYDGASVTSAGLIAGAATIVGGIVGNIIGAKVADYYRPKLKNAYFLVPALFTLPATVFILLVINVTNSLGAAIIFLFLGNILVWTYTGPISAISISVIPPRLRARSAGLLIFFQHILGDIISPPIIGAISDSSGSLQRGMQLTWIALGLSGTIYWCGYQFLAPLESYELQACADSRSSSSSSPSSSSSSSFSSGGAGTTSPISFSKSGASKGTSAVAEVEMAKPTGGSGDEGEGQQAYWSIDQIPMGSDSGTPGPRPPAPTYFELIFGNSDPLVLRNRVPVLKG